MINVLSNGLIPLKNSRFYIDLQWFGGTAAPIFSGSNIDNATRSLGNSEDTPVTGWAKADPFIVALAWEATATKGTPNNTYQLQWRNLTDAGAWTTLAATGALNWTGATNLVNNNALISGEAICTGSGTFVDGIEREGANDYTVQLAAATWTETQWSIDSSGAIDSKEYEFRLWDNSNAVVVGTGLATITMAAAAGVDYTRSISDSIGLTDDISIIGTFKKLITDNVGLTDAITTIVGKLASISDNVGLTDLIIKIGTFIKSIADGIGLTDSISKRGTFKRSIFDSMPITESLLTTLNAKRSVNDNIGLADIISTSLLKFVNLSDNVGIADGEAGVGFTSATWTNPLSALLDFSGMVNINLATQGSDFWDDVNTTDGRRGRAFKDDGITELATDWIDFNSTAKTGWLRVKWSGTLTSSGTQIIRIFSPNTRNTAYAKSDTYGSDNAYASHWKLYLPMEEDGASSDFFDRTANGNDGINTNVLQNTSGKVGNACDYNLTGRTNAGSDSTLDDLSEFTYLAWGEYGSSASATKSRIIDKGDGNDTGTGPLFRVDYISPEVVRLYGEVDYSTTNAVVYSTTNIWNATPTWKHLALTFLSDDLEIYLNGSNDTNSNTAGIGSQITDASRNLNIGNSAFDTRDWPESLDDVQVHSVALSADWISEEYSQTNDNATFWGTWNWTAGAGAGITTILSAVRSISDSIGLTDSITKIGTFKKLISDGITITDVLTAVKLGAAKFATIADNIGITDSISTILIKVASISDNIGLTDLISKKLTAVKNLSDNIGLTDLITKIGTFKRTVSDGITITDILTGIKLGAAKFASLSDNIGLTDIISAKVLKVVSISDSVGLTDLISKIVNFRRSISENVNVSDIISKIGTFKRTVTDNISITDLITKIGTFIRSIADTIGLTDLLTGKLESEKIIETLYFNIDKTESLDFDIDKVESINFNIDKVESLDFDITIE